MWHADPTYIFMQLDAVILSAGVQYEFYFDKDIDVLSESFLEQF